VECLIGVTAAGVFLTSTACCLAATLHLGQQSIAEHFQPWLPGRCGRAWRWKVNAGVQAQDLEALMCDYRRLAAAAWVEEFKRAPQLSEPPLVATPQVHVPTVDLRMGDVAAVLMAYRRLLTAIGC
jgi:hypothetical protein